MFLPYVFSFLDLVHYLHCFHLFLLSFLIFSLCITGFSYIDTEHHCLLTVDVIGYHTFLWQLYLGLHDFTLGTDDSPDMWKMVHYFFLYTKCSLQVCVPSKVLGTLWLFLMWKCDKNCLFVCSRLLLSSFTWQED